MQARSAGKPRIGRRERHRRGVAGSTEPSPAPLPDSGVRLSTRITPDLLSQIPSVKTLAHITSDGFLNLTRVKAGVSYVIDALPPAPPIFSIIARLGEVDQAEMFAVYNMGIGFCAVVSEAGAKRAISILGSGGKRAWRIGFVVADGKRTVNLPKQKLIGQGKHFRRNTG